MRIKDIAVEERPRERMAKQGPQALSTAELLALVLRQGSAQENVLDLAQRILQHYNLRTLSRATYAELQHLSSIGDAKACQLLACFELGRRLAAFQKEKRITIHSAKDVAKMLLPEMSTLQQEHCKGMYLDARKRVLKEETLFIGSLTASVIHPRELFQKALLEGAAACILVHNHPSGDPAPSEEDIALTKQLRDAGNLLGITFLDHIIIGQKNFCSLREEGFFES